MNCMIGDNTYYSVNQSIAQGASYEAPHDGLYLFRLGSDSGNGVLLDAHNNKTLAICMEGNQTVLCIPLRKGRKVRAREYYGTYEVTGYYSY